MPVPAVEQQHHRGDSQQQSDTRRQSSPTKSTTPALSRRFVLLQRRVSSDGPTSSAREFEKKWTECLRFEDDQTVSDQKVGVVQPIVFSTPLFSRSIFNGNVTGDKWMCSTWSPSGNRFMAIRNRNNPVFFDVSRFVHYLLSFLCSR